MTQPHPSARNMDAHKEQLRAFDTRKEIMEAMQVWAQEHGRKPTQVRLDVQRFTAAEQLVTRSKDGTPLLIGMEVVQDDEAEGGLTFA